MRKIIEKGTVIWGPDLDAEEVALQIAKESFGCETIEEACKKLDEGYLRGSTAAAQLSAIRRLIKDD